MSSDSDQEGLGRPGRFLVEAAVEADTFRKGVNEYLSKKGGPIPPKTRSEYASVVIDYYDRLKQHRDETALNEEWENRGVDWLKQMQYETVLVEKQLPRSNGATKQVQRPALQTVSAGEIERVLDELQLIAKELGFGPRIEKATNRVDIPDEQFEEVKEWQQRNQ